MNREDTTEILNGYKLSRSFWDFAFENPDKIKPTHIALFFYAVELCNQLGWKEKFGLPASMALEAIGIKSYSVYKKCFDDLVAFGFFEVIQYSKNQHTCNIIALKENSKASNKAHSKALAKQLTKQGEYNKTNKLRTSKHVVSLFEQVEVMAKLPFESENFIKWWDTWKQYRQDQFRKKYKSVISEQTALKILVTCSGGIESSAISLIEKSIAQGWKGFFELEQNGKSKEEVKWRGF